MERFFVTINKINSVLLCLVLLGSGIGLLVMLLGDLNWNKHKSEESPPSAESHAEVDPQQAYFRLKDDVQVISGANTQLIELEMVIPDHSRFSKSSNNSESRNVLFLRGDDSQAHWLFKENTQLIAGVSQLVKPDVTNENAPALALLIETVPNDSDGDGTLSLADLLDLGLSKPDGSSYVVVLQGADRILSRNTLDNDTLSILYKKGTQVRQAKVSLQNFKRVLDQEITHLPKNLTN